jgi:hypothetical protein
MRNSINCACLYRTCTVLYRFVLKSHTLYTSRAYTAIQKVRKNFCLTWGVGGLSTSDRQRVSKYFG